MPDRYGENEPNRSYPQGNPADFVAGRMVDACDPSPHPYMPATGENR